MPSGSLRKIRFLDFLSETIQRWFVFLFPRFSSFLKSLYAYYELYSAGLTISRSEVIKGLIVHRFFWNGKLIRDIADINFIIDDGEYKTVLNGRIVNLSKPDPYYNKEYHYHMNQMED